MTITRAVSVAAVAIVGMVLSLILVPLLARLGHRWGLLDHPGGRKSHYRAVPLVGGLAIALSGFAALGIGNLWEQHTGGFSWWFFGAAYLILVIGVSDDVYVWPHRTKFLWQIAVITPLIVLTQLKVSNLGAILGGGVIHLDYLAIPFTLLCLVGYINAANMIDGLDGLAGGVALISLAFLAVYAGLLHLFGWVTDICAFAAATLGFLLYNLRMPWRNQAAVFLGDGGSLLLGLVVGWFAIRIVAQTGPHAVSPASIAWILALPVMDTLVVMGRRLFAGCNPFKPDRRHLHHTLINIGLSQAQTTWVMLALAFAYGLYGYLGYVYGLPDWVFFVSFLCVLLLHAVFSVLADRLVYLESVKTASLDSIAP